MSQSFRKFTYSIISAYSLVEERYAHTLKGDVAQYKSAKVFSILYYASRLTCS
jgi:hypothetical protein